MANDSVVFLSSILIAISLLTWKGVENGSVLAAISDQTFTETAISYATTEPSQNQLVEMNTLQGSSFVSHETKRPLAMLDDQIIDASEHIGSDGDDMDRVDISDYEIQEGDTLGGIASDFGISLQTIISANKNINVNALKPGSKLRIPPINGLIYKVQKGDTVSTLAKKFQADSSKIISYNTLPQAGDLRIGDEVIIPDGIAPKNSVVAKNTDTSNRRFALLPNLNKEFVAPATCIITQLVHGLNGVDCANKIGTPIYAAASGTVVIAKTNGQNYGYGKYLKIAHPNGTSTLYAHLNSLTVSIGQTVSQGEQIGYMGNNGRSSGPHLHFELRGARNFLADYGLRKQVTAGR